MYGDIWDEPDRWKDLEVTWCVGKTGTHQVHGKLWEEADDGQRFVGIAHQKQCPRNKRVDTKAGLHV